MRAATLPNGPCVRERLMSRHCNLGGAELEALFAAGVTAEDVQTYLAIRQYRNGRTGEAFPSRARIGTLVGVTERRVTPRICRLERAGLIACGRSTGKATRYTFPLVTPDVRVTSTPDAGVLGTPDAERHRPLTPSDRTPDADVPRTKDLEQVRASRQAEHVVEAGRKIAHWWGREIDPAALARLAEGILPSAFRRAVENLTGREHTSVRAPLSLLHDLIADEEAKADDF